MVTICSRNHGSMAVISYNCAGVAPSHSACWTFCNRPSCGRPTSESRSSSGRGSAGQENSEPFCSTLRRAFCRACAKLRPRAMASPTLFIVVVSVSSAPGNFSKAKRGTFTTM